jgi:hypothetical protein
MDYYTTIDNLKETIEKHGVAVIPNLLNDEECDNMVNSMWDYLEHITQDWKEPIKRNDETTYKNIYNLFQKNISIKMIVKFWGIGHCKMAWDLRQNPKIVNVFANFWNVKPEELLVSFDASSFHFPPEITGDEFWTKQYRWYHTDQSYTTNNFTHLQSWITGLDVNEDDSTLAFLENSHNYHKEFADYYDIKDPNDWYILNKDELDFYYKKGCKEKIISCPKGSLVLWDGRTIHCGLEPSKNRIKPNFRCITYLCYMPRKFATDEEIIEKQQIFNSMLTTTHNPYKNLTIPKTPYINLDEEDFITPINKPKLTELGYKLAGF